MTPAQSELGLHYSSLQKSLRNVVDFFLVSQTLIFNRMRDSPDDCESGWQFIS